MMKPMTTTSSVGHSPVDGAPALLTYEGAGRVLGVSPRTVWGLVRAGKLRAARFGRSVRIDRADLMKFIEQAKDNQDG